MNAASSSTGVVGPTTAVPLSTAAPTTVVPAVWPRSAQVASVVLVLTVVGLLTWHVYGRQRRAARPTALDAGSMAFRVDLNRADRAQLLQLPGVGEALVGRIEHYRAEHYGFHSIDELAEISGIGPLTVERLRHLVYVEPPDDDDKRGDVVPVRMKQLPAKKKDIASPMKPSVTKKENALNDPININQASAEELQHLPGIGPALAARVIEARRTAPFKSADDLRRVAGIGPKTLDKLRPHITVGEVKRELAKKE